MSRYQLRVQELCESRGGRPGLSVLMSLTVFVDVKQHSTNQILFEDVLTVEFMYLLSF